MAVYELKYKVTTINKVLVEADSEKEAMDLFYEDEYVSFEQIDSEGEVERVKKIED